MNVVARAKALELALAELGTEAKVARAHAMTPAGVSQYLAVARRLPADLLAGMVVETEPARLRKWSLRALVEIARDEGEGRRRLRLAALLRVPAMPIGHSSRCRSPIPAQGDHPS